LALQGSGDKAENQGSLDTSSIKLTGSDISARDNASLAQAASAIAATFAELRGRGVIDDAELLRVVYRFAGELVDVPEMLERGKAAAASGHPLPEGEGRGEGELP
jgi:hypothetical protein